LEKSASLYRLREHQHALRRKLQSKRGLKLLQQSSTICLSQLGGRCLWPVSSERLIDPKLAASAACNLLRNCVA